MPPQRLDARDAGHVEVEQHDVGPLREHRADALEAVRGLAHHREVALLRQQGDDAAAEQRVVVHDDDADHAARSLALCERHRQHDLGARAGDRADVQRRADPLRALAHDAQPHVVVARLVAARVEPAPVVAHREDVPGPAPHLDVHDRGVRVLAHVRQRLLQDVHDVELHVRRQGQRLAARLQPDLHAGLPLEARGERADAVLDVALAGAGAEVDQQLAHVGIGFLHAGLDLVGDAGDARLVARGDRAAQHLHLQVEERERLRDRVVQLAREQAALLGRGQLALLGDEPQVLDRHPQVLPEALQHVTLLRGELARIAEEEIVDAQHLVLRGDGEGADGAEARLAGNAAASRTAACACRPARARSRCCAPRPRRTRTRARARHCSALDERRRAAARRRTGATPRPRLRAPPGARRRRPRRWRPSRGAGSRGTAPRSSRAR